ncbi:NUDIX domain-containing protein [Streptoalloteichus tenebrarius]|uniref:NUDIX domain-containing protein n=1 Tax=Streptoalloteichus tenebrarius (strain ATCC 17920 / DSM 40477 / JCM 4838 / CBS 697.72 / NBRC 16177 / NCIMB 11028 / NRRL B-12390 / A12253. 1 / ISP 5477) TaxID=1933 RepID=A0ABT1I1K8_STRSD|nr:NUDIX domain-containing protein [Streptoalloteichus tenebrarius]MCP2261649.1 NUDIX domain-containing protein [Streptoalloteichus tenebrarius]
MFADTMRWVEQWPPPPTPPIRQVYGVVFHGSSGAVVIQDDAGRYNLPGGTPEPGDADLVATLRRECYEESQLVLADWRPVGYQLVSNDDSVYVQVRYAALLAHADPVAVDPCTGRAYGRVLVSPTDAAALLGWGERGVAQVAAATAAAVKAWGITPAPAGWPRQDLV